MDTNKVNDELKEKLLSLVPKTAYHYDRVVFLENSNGLHYEGAADGFREFLIDNKVRHHVVYNLSSLDKEALVEVAKDCLDTLVVFETTGTTQEFKFLLEVFILLTNKGYHFRFMECSTYDFQLYRLPENVGNGLISYHNLQCSGFDSEWKLREVTK